MVETLPWVDNSVHIKPTAIVLHWWGPLWRLGPRWLYFFMKRKGTSVQFAVLTDGSILKLTDSPDVFCKHARCANKSAIGVEIQGWRWSLDKNKKQLSAVATLVQELCNQFKINPEFKVEQLDQLRFYGVTSHKVVDRYCDQKRLLPKKDVHDEYVARVIERLETKK